MAGLVDFAGPKEFRRFDCARCGVNVGLGKFSVKIKRKSPPMVNRHTFCCCFCFHAEHSAGRRMQSTIVRMRPKASHVPETLRVPDAEGDMQNESVEMVSERVVLNSATTRVRWFWRRIVYSIRHDRLYATFSLENRKKGNEKTMLAQRLFPPATIIGFSHVYDFNAQIREVTIDIIPPTDTFASPGGLVIIIK